MKLQTNYTSKEFQVAIKSKKISVGAKKGDKAKAEMWEVIRIFGRDIEHECDKEYKFAADRKFKFDFILREHFPKKIKIAIEYEGLMSEKSGHTTVTGYTSNCDKYNLAATLGWIVLRYTALNYKQLEADLKQLLK